MQRSMTCAVIVILTGAFGLLFDTPARAQYTADYQTNIVSGVTSNWSGDSIIGNSGTYADVLLIQSGGVLSNGTGYVGYGTGYSMGDNEVIISGTGSVWNNSGSLDTGDMSDNNQLIVTNGGTLYSVGGVVGDLSSQNNMVLITGAGSVWNNASNLTVGVANAGNNSLTIADGGAVYNTVGTLAIGTDSGGSTVVVTGSGSVLNTGTLELDSDPGGNSMIVSNGGVVNSTSSGIGGNQNNSVLITGKGSVWNSGSLVIEGIDASLTISDGALVQSYEARLQSGQSGSSVLVTGSGSTWDIQGSLDEVTENRCSVTVSNEGTVIAGDVNLDNSSSISISGGGLYITNGLDTGLLQAAGQLTFNSGTLATRATTINNGSVFTVGDGTDPATFIMVSGGSGFHFFANGLTISSNATLTGVGTIIGTTLVNAGGVLAPGDAPGSITFSNSLTLAAGSTFALTLNGVGAGQYDQIVGLGTISVSNSVLSLSLGYTPSVGDTYTIISNLGPASVFGTFDDTHGDTLTNYATFAMDGTTFQIDYTANADGQDVTLTAVVPEPSSLLLAALGTFALWTVARRKS
jgi:fibronectin-binding autotransporter adhesin